MQEKSHSHINLLIAIAVLVALGVAGYFYETRDRSSDSNLLVSSPSGASSGTDAVEGDLLTALGQLRRLSLDDSIFRNPIFTSLTDYSTELIPQPAGRPNPFAPIATTSTDTVFTVSSSLTAPASTPAPVAVPAASTTAPASTTTAR